MFTVFPLDECTEELLDLHDKEVQRWKSYYEENSEMLDKVAKRQVLWKEYLEFEVCTTELYLEYPTFGYYL